MCYCNICANKYSPQIPHMKICSWRYKQAMLVYMPHMNPLQLTMWPRTLVYIYFTSLAYVWTNIPATLHISVPLHVYYTLHIDPTLLHVSVNKHQNATNLACYCQLQICPWNATCPNYSLCINEGCMLIYIWHMN